MRKSARDYGRRNDQAMAADEIRRTVIDPGPVDKPRPSATTQTRINLSPHIIRRSNLLLGHCGTPPGVLQSLPEKRPRNICAPITTELVADSGPIYPLR